MGGVVMVMVMMGGGRWVLKPGWVADSGGCGGPCQRQ